MDTTHESTLVAAARAGETDALIEYLYTVSLPGLARRLAEVSSRFGTRLDPEDVLHQGIECAIHYLPRALETEKPFAYLVRVCQSRMLAYCREQRCSIRVPYGSQMSGTLQPIVASLDAPLIDDMTLLDLVEAPAPSAPGERTESRACALHAALRRLPLDEQAYLYRVYGLNAYQPVPLASDYVKQPRETKTVSASCFRHLRKDRVLEAAL